MVKKDARERGPYHSGHEATPIGRSSLWNRGEWKLSETQLVSSLTTSTYS